MPPAEEHPTPGFQTDRVLTLTAAHALHDVYAAFLAPLLPHFIEVFRLTKTEAGLLSMVVQGASLIQPFIGRAADRFNLVPLVMLTPAVTATVMSLIGIAPSYGWLVLLLLVSGFSSAGIHATGPVLTGNVSGDKLGRGMGFWMVGGELGRALGPVVIVTAVKVLAFPQLPWLMVGGFATSAVLWVQLRDVSLRPPPGLPAAPSLRQGLRMMGPFVGVLAGLLAARSFMIVTLSTYLPTLLTEEGSSLWLAGVSLTALETAGVVGALIGGSLSDRLGRRRVLFGSMISSSLLMLLFLAVEGWVRFPLLLLLGLTALSVAPVIMASVQENFPQSRSMANGIYMALNFGIRVPVLLVVGALADWLGLHTAFVISAILSLVGLPFLRWLPVPERRR
ncbi:MAG: MFS transporter [Chloroflexi bacterium]|nr:MFS transporter [Chloroflexota bacterium]